MKRFLFIALLVVFGCEKEDELPYRDLSWISFDRYYSWLTDYSTQVYKLNSATGYPSVENTSSYQCKYIHYYPNEKYFEYERTNSTTHSSMDISDTININYQEK